MPKEINDVSAASVNEKQLLISLLNANPDFLDARTEGRAVEITATIQRRQTERSFCSNVTSWDTETTQSKSRSPPVNF